MPIRILQVSPYASSHVGGVEYVVHELCTFLAREPRFSVSWCAGAEQNDRDLPNVRYVPLRSYTFIQRLTGVPYPLWGLISLVRLWNEVRRNDIVHIHDHVKFLCSMAFLFAYVSRKKILLTLHGPLRIDSLPATSPFRSASLTVQGMLSSFIVRRSDRITAVSRIAERALKEEDPDLSCILIPNGVNDDLFHPVTETERADLRRQLGIAEGPTLLFVGRFVRSKGIETIREIATRNPVWQWEIVGAMNGPDAVDPGTWNLPNVRVRGRIADRKLLATLYQAADVLVAPSRRDIEDIALVVLEALACGLPPLMAQKGAYDRIDPSLLRVVEEHTDADTWEKAIRELLAQDRASFVRRSADCLAHMQWRSTVHEYIAEYERLAS